MLKAALCSIVLVAAVGVATPAQADAIDTLQVGQYVTFADGPGPNAAGGGGPFTITAPTDFWETFCLEFGEHMNYSSSFYVGAISDSAINGGVGGAVGSDPFYPLDQRDPLSVETRAIYHKYRTNNNLGWTGDVVQWAIWIFEQEKQLADNPGNAVVTWANVNAASYDFGTDAVKAINLYTDASKTTRAQDQLMIQPTSTPRDVPEPTILMLFGSALTALVARRRRTPQR